MLNQIFKVRMRSHSNLHECRNPVKSNRMRLWLSETFLICWPDVSTEVLVEAVGHVLDEGDGGDGREVPGLRHQVVVVAAFHCKTTISHSIQNVGQISVELYIVGINFATFSILYFWILLIWGWNESFIGCPHEMAPDGCQFEEMRAFQTRIWFDSPASVNLKTKFTFYTYLIMHRMQKKYLWGLTMGT